MNDAMDYVDARKYLDVLRDPVDGGRLELIENTTLEMLGTTSGLRYCYQGAFPDLRPDAGKSLAAGQSPARLDARTAISHTRVRTHYDDKPCNNYMCLDNVPLGKYLRDSCYDTFFENVQFVVEVGSGKGAVALALKHHRGITPFCIDLAYGSLRHVRAEPLRADGVLGSNLALPLADSVADMVISYGVIHHTPNPLLAFRELVRILKPGGRLLLNVYNWENLYRSLYFFFSPPFKAVKRFLGPTLGELVLKTIIFVPYHVALWLVLGMVQRRWRFPNLRDSWEQFGDFFLTPIARFYHAGELVTMGEVLGLHVLEQETGGWPQNGFAHFVWYQKQ